MTLLMRANRGARGKAATNMVVKLNWITKEGEQRQILVDKTGPVCVLHRFLSGARTHLQKLIEQAEGVDIVETVVADPVSKLAVLTQFSSVFDL